jgi:glucosamine--fructose-6-phosphate aminotransferase (isomerizing)
VLLLIALWFSQRQPKNYQKRVQCIRELHKLQSCVTDTIALSEKLCPQLVKYFEGWPSCFVLGKGTGEGIALEGALKIKEISYIHAEGKSASSLKHGPFALLQPGFPVILIALDNEYFDKCLNTLEELKSRKAVVIFITNTAISPNKADIVIQVPNDTKYIGDILCTIPLQMLAYHLSIARGLNPDFPRNLAKVVTVE